MPMLADNVGHLGQPRTVSDQFQYLHGRKEFDRILRRIPERLEHSGGNQNWHIVRLATQDPRRLFSREPSRRLSNQSHKLMLHFFHKFIVWGLSNPVHAPAAQTAAAARV